MPDLDPARRSLAGRIGAHASWAKTADPAARTSHGRAAFDSRFEREVDPEGVLPPAERARRAAHARKAYFARLALKSAEARRKTRKRTAVVGATDAELAGGGVA